MIRTTSLGALALAFFAAEVAAQQPLWAQCGGISWPGGTTCVSGATCTRVNDWFYQCLPPRVTTTTSATTTNPITMSTPTSTTTTSSVSIPPSTPFTGKQIFGNPQYKTRMQTEYNSLISEGNTALAAKVAKLFDVPVSIWIGDRASVPNIGTYLQSAKTLQSQYKGKQIVSLVVYDLPDRDCSGGASAGEFSSADGGEAKYQEFIQAVKGQIEAYPDVDVAIVLEPDSIGNIITNQGIPFCATAAPVHKRGLAYAISVLGALNNVYLYLDGAHATWLGWPDNLGPTADLFGSIYTAAKQLNPNAVVRGISTDVSNYNDFDTESTYHANLKPYLDQVGFPAHFVVDQGRSGNQNVTRGGEDWCNWRYAGLGQRPTAGNTTLLDAILWVKPPGDSDGTSDPNSTRYNPVCASNTSFVPSPEAGLWASAAFRSMVELANPPL